MRRVNQPFHLLRRFTVFRLVQTHTVFAFAKDGRDACMALEFHPVAVKCVFIFRPPFVHVLSVLQSSENYHNGDFLLSENFEEHVVVLLHGFCDSKGSHNEDEEMNTVLKSTYELI
jgi:hypothetical protein